MAKKKRHPNPRLSKKYRTYTVEEIAILYGIHKNTVRQWIKDGLPAIDGQRPMLVHGRDLRAFLENRRKKNKQPCQAGEMYCLRCRIPQHPAGNMADYKPATPTLGSLIGMCPSCETMMYRRVSRAKLDQAKGELEVTFTEEPAHIDECA